MNINYSNKQFAEDNFFVLYDVYDNIVCYYDNFKELKHSFSGYRLRDLKRRFIVSKYDYILVIFHNVIHKLYTFTDDALIYV